jgi:hypothetical protein
MATEYYGRWYAAKKDDRNKKRRDKYATDQEYREKVVSHVRMTREQARTEQSAVRVRMPPKPHETEYAGQKVSTYTLGSLALMLQRSNTSLLGWERAGILPVTPIRDGRQIRQYTLEMMKVVKEAVARKGQVSLNDVALFEEINAAWKALGFEGHRLEKENGHGNGQGGWAGGRAAGDGGAGDARGEEEHPGAEAGADGDGNGDQ